MQFVANGPDIPDALLELHEEGRVVFFCGAGISYPAGLPGFGDLVSKLFQLNHTSPSAIEQQALERDQYDATLELLERRLPGQRRAMRSKLPEALKPNLRRRGALDTHEALLTLGRGRDERLRLVTTNFDPLFQKASKRLRQPLKSYAAPMLPVPKNSRWDGLVYLHGEMTNGSDDAALSRLILTSGDFGLAYLTERWAARFATELFRNYVVCFIGYSINDPVMRYMMDALAADRRLGEQSLQAWAFGDFKPGQEEDKVREWEAKGVQPILYEVPTGTHDHSALHRSLREWAQTYRDGVMGCERVVQTHALARPSASTRQDDFVGRMLWALSHKSGLPAKCFADFNPVPTLDWLFKAFITPRYQHDDLPRFGVEPCADQDEKLRFSLVQRPSPYRLSAYMTMLSGGPSPSQWDPVMYQLARWLARHLNDGKLLLWIASNDGRPHELWRRVIDHRLDELERLERDGKLAELEEIRAHAPNAIPNPLMRKLWRHVLEGRVRTNWSDLDLYQWTTRLERDGLTPSLRLGLRKLLEPALRLDRPMRLTATSDSDEAADFSGGVDWEVGPAAENVRSSLTESSAAAWASVLPRLLEELQQLLIDTLEVKHELSVLSDREEHSYWALPSVEPHWQNKARDDWGSLMELVRDSWISVEREDRKRAMETARLWFSLPYSPFKRLALFAASQDGMVEPDLWVQWLTSDAGTWLWSNETQREVLRLLASQGHKIQSRAARRLIVTILSGPARESFSRGEEPAEWQWYLDRVVWLRLATLQSVGVDLGAKASARLRRLGREHPQWALFESQQHEFLSWTSGTGDPDFEASRQIDVAPRRRDDLVGWLRQSPQRTFMQDDTWRERCRTHPLQCLEALAQLSSEDNYPIGRWEDALGAWEAKGRLRRTWRCVAPAVQRFPASVLSDLAHSVSRWLKAVADVVSADDPRLLDLCQRVLALPLSDTTGITSAGKPLNEPVMEALNHPVGHVAQAILNAWFKRSPADNDGLPPNLKPLFTQLCDRSVARFRHGRVLLASRLIALFRVDRDWTQQYLLPFFNWDDSKSEARAVWDGFLWSPRLYRPLLVAFKKPFLGTAFYYDELAKHGQQYVTVLVYAALERVDGYQAADYQAPFAALPQSALLQAAQALKQALGAAGEQRGEFWSNRVLPFWQDVWPKSLALANPLLSGALALLCIEADAAFPQALEAVHDWLMHVEHPDRVVHQLHGSALCSRFPNDALRLLDAIIDEPQWFPRDLSACLKQIAEAAPKLVRSLAYKRLHTYARTRGI